MQVKVVRGGTAAHEVRPRVVLALLVLRSQPTNSCGPVYKKFWYFFYPQSEVEL